MIILAIDPGPDQSGWIRYDTSTGKILFMGIDSNDFLRMMIESSTPETGLVVLEMIGHYGTGMPAGKTVFDTCVWIGEFKHARRGRGRFEIILPQTIRTHICGNPKAKKANVAQALRDRFGEKGTKRNPGLLYGIKSHMWSALAVAITAADTIVGNESLPIGADNRPELSQPTAQTTEPTSTESERSSPQVEIEFF